MKKKIKIVTVLGASGTIGSLIGGLLAQNGFKVYFLSRTLAGSKNGCSRAIIQARSKIITNNIICGDYEHLFEKACCKSDWILECVAEDVTVKRQMYEMVDACRKKDSIVSTVSSSLPLDVLSEGYSDSFCRHFLSTHFYNPPTKMAACELTGLSKTNPAIVNFMHDFLAQKLQRVVIRVKPVAALAGNRIAFLLFAQITELVEKFGTEMMDYLIGPYTGRLMAPLATIDLIGIDLYRAIIHNIQVYTDDSFYKYLSIPGYIDRMISKGFIGNKIPNKGGFYKKLENGKFIYYDPTLDDYIPSFGHCIQAVERSKSLIHIGLYKEAFKIILSSKNAEAEIVRKILSTYIAYAYTLVGQVTEEKYGILNIDRVMLSGFHWASPSLLVHMFGGAKPTIALINSIGIPVPKTLRNDSTGNKYNNFGKFFLAC